ncbi:hypothetical protein BKA66DRAFT_97040 [Pyrenochaeta sp. MPI-SDFR-AT-0127]|nr:hypothetical protein BKA66DRAFT_97040 [Pyrenochaeta sp. MPI-SDFR-AT-0127]
MRAFAGGFYGNLKALYDHLGVRYRTQHFLFEFAKPQSGPSQGRGRSNVSYFVHASNMHQPPPRPISLGIIAYVVEAVYLLACYAWFSICCFMIAPERGETLQHYLQRTWVSQRFVTSYLLPLISSVTTCPHASLLGFPASDVIEYKRKTHRAPHYTVSDGVREVQDRLLQEIPCEFSATVTCVNPFEKGVRVSWKKGSEAQMTTELFDRVVIAVSPDVVGHIFAPLQHHMSRIPVAVVESVVHTDQSVLHKGAVAFDTDKHGAQLIYLHTTTEDVHKTASHHVQPCGPIVTTCPLTPISPAFAIRSAKFTRVLRNPESQRIVNAIFENFPPACADEKHMPPWRNGDNNVWLAGGWCWDGMVLLEGCVVSAMRVADDFGVNVPWRCPKKNYAYCRNIEVDTPRYSL